MGAPEDLRKHLRLAPQDATVGRLATATEPSDAALGRERAEIATDTFVTKVPALGASDGPASTLGEPQLATDRGVPPVSPMREAALTTSGPVATAVAPSVDQPASVAEVSRGEVADEAPGAGSALDLNTASMAALNHIPGMSNIGRAIVTHRPYRSVDDLMSRHVLRSADFRRVKDKVKV